MSTAVSPTAPDSDVALEEVERDAVALGLGASLRTAIDALDPPADGQRRWWRIVATDTFDAWLIDWPEATGVPRHDHAGAAASICVVRGELTETRFPSDGAPAVRVAAPGDVFTVGADASHLVENRRPEPATSVHVYSPPLRSMGFFDGTDEPVRRDAVDPSPTLWATVLP